MTTEAQIEAAARKCGVKDSTGKTLPDDIWRQAIPDARAALSTLGKEGSK